MKLVRKLVNSGLVFVISHHLSKFAQLLHMNGRLLVQDRAWARIGWVDSGGVGAAIGGELGVARSGRVRVRGRLAVERVASDLFGDRAFGRALGVVVLAETVDDKLGEIVAQVTQVVAFARLAVVNVGRQFGHVGYVWVWVHRVRFGLVWFC